MSGYPQCTMTPAMVATARVTRPDACATPVSHAAHELARYLAALVSTPVPEVVASDRLPGTVVLLGDDASLAELALAASRDLAEDGSTVVVRESGIAIAGTNPRGTLYGVYGLLHELGCRWLTPADDEIIPALDEIRLPAGTRRSAPTFRRRGFGEDTRAVPPDDEGWFNDLVGDTRRFACWMAKNRLSHLTTTAGALADIPALRDDLDRYGIVSSYGTGHNIPRLLPRELFAIHPDYVRMDASGQRRPDGNLCVSNADAVRIVVSNALEEVRENQPVEIYSVQGADTSEGSWCACPNCREMSPLQQNLLLCRAVADGLQAAGMPDTRVALAAYQSTIEPEIDPSELPERLVVHFAPRARSYADSVTADSNRQYARQLAGWASLVGQD
ncbi:MAG TPA: DUF4838 domain-containing protein, partial [Thermomicrobiales bacterium]|nr:DUF4838 domain-containing protein [Thermomicrobiales bacterium]